MRILKKLYGQRCGWGLFEADGNYWMYMDQPTTRMAYAKARQARFEHGETPRASMAIETIRDPF